MESEWPIMTGVPFPQGVLFSQDQVRLLDEDGQEVQCQTSVRSIWNRHGSIRWIGLDFLGDLTTPGAKYALEFGKQVKRASMKEMAVIEDADAIRVDTGPLQFMVRKRGFNLLDDVHLNGDLVSSQDTAAGLELTDHEGSVYRAANDPDSSVAAHYVVAAYDQLFWNYYVTGNRRALDVAMEWVESIKKIHPRPQEGREGVATAGELVEAYQATWDAGLLEIMDAFAQRAGSVAFGEQHAVNWGLFINRYLAFTGNENFRRRLLEWHPDDWYGDVPKPNIRALRYYETGDASHLREVLPQMFFISLRYSTEPPQISEGSYLYSWFILAFRVMFWQPYLRGLVDEGIPLFVESQEGQPFPAGGRVVEKQAGDGKTQSVCVIAAGTEAQFPGSQVWYFRTAQDQKVLELQVPAVSERGIHIRTSDGSRIVAHIGSDGYRVGGSEGTLKAAVQPNTLYYLATGTLKSPNRIIPVGYPLILARMAEEWFEPGP